MPGSSSAMSPPLARSDAEPSRKRKKRAHLSCAECRRLKLKCDRQVPCSNCTRRKCIDICPDGTRPVRATEESLELRERLEALERILASKGIDLLSKKDAGRSSPSPRQRRSDSQESADSNEASEAEAPQRKSPKQDQSLANDFAPPPAEEVTSVRFDYTQTPSAMTLDPGSAGRASQTSQQNQHHSLFPSPNALPPSVSGPSGTSPEDQSFGTLVISQSGRSKYLGPTAASEWLKDQETAESPPASRPGSPPPERPAAQFPFGGAVEPATTEFLLSKLPPLDEACVLVDAYYRYFSWAWNVSPRETFQPIFERVYRQDPPRRRERDEWLHGLALVFITLALGALHNLELPPNDPLAEEFFSLAKSALAKGQFMVHNTIAAVQTLHIMAHFCLETERGRNGDNAWPLWGLAMRLIQAMGLHRDGSRWSLAPDVLDERRRVFWECHTADIFQANCFSRPNSINADHIDAVFPADVGMGSGKGYMALKHELGTISALVLDHAMKVHAPPYSTVMALHERLVNFESSIPFYYRCRTVLLALPSRYADTESAIRDSPDESKRDLHRTFQQFTLYLNVSEAIMFLHRPYFVRALHDHVSDPTLSMYGRSYLTVVERCNAIIQLVTRVHALHPNVTARHWFFWYHAFNAAVCVGTLILTNPQNPLAGFALAQIDAAIALYTGVVQGRTSRRMVHNLQWLLRLRQRASDRMARADTTASGGTAGQQTDEEARDEGSDSEVELLGWRTRLIQRAAKGQKATTIALPSPLNSATSASPNATIQATVANALQAHFAQPAEPMQTSLATDASTDALLQQFWDPMLLQDIPDLMGSSFTMGWDWDSGGAVEPPA